MKNQSDALLRAALQQTKLEPLPAELKRQIMHQVYHQSSMTKPAMVKPLMTRQTWLLSGFVIFIVSVLVFLLERTHKVTVLPFIKWLNQPFFILTSVVCLSFFVLLLLDTYLIKKWPKFGLSAWQSYRSLVAVINIRIEVESLLTPQLLTL